MKTLSARIKNLTARRLRNPLRRNPRRLRRLLFEQFEDRRVLAAAADDSFWLVGNGPLSGNTSPNDDYNWSWTHSWFDYETQEWVYESEYATWSVVEPDLKDSFSFSEGNFEYTPGPGFIDTDSFTYQVCDNGGWSDTATVTITRNTPPEAASDTFVVAKNGSLTISESSLLANDEDANGHSLAADVSSPVHGSLTPNLSGDYTYVPANDYSGWDSFDYRAYDGYEYSDSSVVWIHVNSRPTAQDDSFTVVQDSEFWISAPGILENDTDPDGNTLTALQNSQPENGTLQYFLGYGQFLYTPVDNYSGPDSFTYIVSDGSLSSQLATVSFTVIPLDPSLVARNDGYTSIAGQPVDIPDPGLGVLANDDPAASGTRTAVLVTNGTHGSVALNANGSFLYVPFNVNFTSDSFTYRFSTGSAVSTTAAVTITNEISDEITATRFYSDGADLFVQYAVLGDGVVPFSIGVYASPDGVALGNLLQSKPPELVNHNQGLHTLEIEPTFPDLPEDYYLVAKIDSDNAVVEINENNNQTTFLPGSFLVNEPATANGPAKTVLHVQGSDGNDNSVTVSYYEPESQWRLWSVKTAIAAPAGGPGMPYYDFTGDGVVTALDADAVNNYLPAWTSGAWQRDYDRFDVDGDGVRTANDALILINDYNAFGEHLLLGLPTGVDLMVDVTGDDVASVLDIAQLLDKLNDGPGDYSPPGRSLAEHATPEQIWGFLSHSYTAFAAENVDEVHIRLHNGHELASVTGFKAAWLGGAGNDTLFGSELPDLLDGGADGDYIRGLVGDDQIMGGLGNDTLYGDQTGAPIPSVVPGKDLIDGGEGNDVLWGGGEDDWLSGSTGDDVLLGEAGDDLLFGDAGFDQLDGGAGHDQLFGNADSDILWGRTGDDILNGGSGDDTLRGEAGNDSLDGGDGADLLLGYDGDNHLVGGGGDDFLYGGNGNDILLGEVGSDSLAGFGGDDVLSGGGNSDTLDGGDGSDSLDGGDGADTATGGDGNDQMSGGAGNDTFDGGTGDDSMDGGAGDDGLSGGDGNDSLTGGDDDDTLDGGAGDDYLDGQGGANTLDGGPGYNYVYENGEQTSEYFIGILPDWGRIADVGRNDGWDDRNVVVTLTGPDGLSMSQVRDIMLHAGDSDPYVTFPLFDPDTDYTVTVTVSAGLTGGGTVNFNSSDVQYDGSGVYQIPPFEILSDGVNEDENGNLPEGYTPPNPDPLPVYANNNGGYHENAQYWTIEGGVIEVDDPENGVLPDDTDSQNSPLEDYEAQVAQGPAHGSLQLFANGTFIYTAAAGFWGLDFFRYKAIVNGVASLMATVYLVVPTIEIQMAPPSSTGDLFYFPVSGLTRQIWVGEQVNLYAQSKGLMNPPVTEASWGIPGKVIREWLETQAAGIVKPLTNADTTNTNTISFYWVDSGLKEVTVTGKVGGVAAAADSAKFDVKRPENVGLDAEPLPTGVSIYDQPDGEKWLSFGNTRMNPPVIGIKFHRRGLGLGLPGKFDWLQVINDTEAHFTLDNGIIRRGFASDLLDRRVIYDDDPSETEDSPGIKLGPAAFPDHGITAAYFSDAFSMYLMWKSNRANSIRVPIRVIEWSAFAGAHIDILGQWVHDFQGYNVEPSQDTTDHPTWLGWAPNNVTWVDGD